MLVLLKDLTKTILHLMKLLSKVILLNTQKTEKFLQDKFGQMMLLIQISLKKVLKLIGRIN